MLLKINDIVILNKNVEIVLVFIRYFFSDVLKLIVRFERRVTLTFNSKYDSILN